MLLIRKNYIFKFNYTFYENSYIYSVKNIYKYIYKQIKFK